jgi:hypothetical protein
MLNQKRDQGPQHESAEKSLISIGAMAFAEEVAADFERLETGYRKWPVQPHGNGADFLSDVPQGRCRLQGVA